MRREFPGAGANVIESAFRFFSPSEIAMSEAKKTMKRPSAAPRRPETSAEMREMMGEIWTLLLEERRIRVEDAKARAKEREEEAQARAKEREERAKERAEEAQVRAKEREEEAQVRAKEREEEAQIRAKEREEWAKEREKAAKEAEKEMKDLRRTVAGIGKRTGDFMANTGRILERDIVAGMKRDGGIGHVKGKVLGPLKKEGEYDGAVINGRETVVVEVKRNLRLKDVRDFLRRRVPRFAKEFPDLAAGRKVYGALAFQLDADDGQAVELARESGLMLAQISSKKRMKILNPDPAKLRPLAK